MEFLQQFEPFILDIYAFLIMFDFLTGVLASAKEGRLKSRSMRDGLFRSSAEILLLGAMVYFKKYVPLDFVGFGVLVLCVGLTIKEGLSITENLYRLDVALPKIIVNSLNLANEKLEEITE